MSLPGSLCHWWYVHRMPIGVTQIIIITVVSCLRTLQSDFTVHSKLLSSFKGPLVRKYTEVAEDKENLQVLRGPSDLAERTGHHQPSLQGWAMARNYKLCLFFWLY